MPPPLRRIPLAEVPTACSPTPVREQRWRQRFSAVRISLPHWARDAPDRALLRLQRDRSVRGVLLGRHRRCAHGRRPIGRTARRTPPCPPTARSCGGSTTPTVTSSARWRAQPFGAGPGRSARAGPADGRRPGTRPAWRSAAVVLAGFSDDDGTRIHLARGRRRAGPGRTGTPRTAASVRCPPTRRVWVLSHSEHGDSRYPALRALSLPTGEVIAELSDAPGKGLAAMTFSPCPRRSAAAGRARAPWPRRAADLGPRRPVRSPNWRSTCRATWTPTSIPDGSALLVVHTHAGRTTVHRYDLASGELTDLPVAVGVVSGASGAAGRVGLVPLVQCGRPRAAAGAAIRTAPTACCSRPPGEPAPGSEPVARHLGGRAGRADPRAAGRAAEPPSGDGPAAWPTVFAVHGGPADRRRGLLRRSRAAWLDAGFAVVQVNYRGSTGYGSAWRDALTERIGHTELADIAAVHDHLIAAGRRRSGRVGDRRLLLGRVPDPAGAGRPAGALGGRRRRGPGRRLRRRLRGRDGAAAGLRPGVVRWIPAGGSGGLPGFLAVDLRGPGAGAGAGAGRRERPALPDPADRQLPRRAGRPRRRYAVYRYDAGHGSMVVAERLRQLACEIGFVREVLGHVRADRSGGTVAGTVMRPERMPSLRLRTGVGPRGRRGQRSSGKSSIRYSTPPSVRGAGVPAACNCSSSPRSSTRRILPEMVLGSGGELQPADPLIGRQMVPGVLEDQPRGDLVRVIALRQHHVGLRDRQPDRVR